MKVVLHQPSLLKWILRIWLFGGRILVKQNLKETFCFLTMKLNQSIQVRKKLVDLRIRHNIHFYHGFVENLKTNNTFQCKIIYFGETRHLILHLLPRLSLTPTLRVKTWREDRAWERDGKYWRGTLETVYITCNYASLTLLRTFKFLTWVLSV